MFGEFQSLLEKHENDMLRLGKIFLQNHKDDESDNESDRISSQYTIKS